MDNKIVAPIKMNKDAYAMPMIFQNTAHFSATLPVSLKTVNVLIFTHKSPLEDMFSIMIQC